MCGQKVFNQFDFYTKGYSKTYDLKFKYFTRYTIDIRDDNKKISRKLNGKMYDFEGKIKFEFFYKETLINTEYITERQRCGIEDSIYYYCELKDFLMPIENRYKNLSIKLTVMEAIAVDSKNKFSLYIGATSLSLNNKISKLPLKG